MKTAEILVQHYGHPTSRQEVRYEPSGKYMNAKEVGNYKPAIERECSRIFGRKVRVEQSMTVGVEWLIFKSWAGSYPEGGANNPIGIYVPAIKSAIELTEYGKQYAPTHQE